MDRIYNEVAKRYNTTADEVEKEIAYALSVARQNPAPAAKAFWGRVDSDADVTAIVRNIVSRLALAV